MREGGEGRDVNWREIQGERYTLSGRMDCTKKLGKCFNSNTNSKALFVPNIFTCVPVHLTREASCLPSTLMAVEQIQDGN